MDVVKKHNQWKYWWILPLLFFNFIYYYFIQYLVDGKSESLKVEIHGEALAFLFIISLLSISCVILVEKMLTRFKVDRLSTKYLASIFFSFLIFITVVIGIQYAFEYGNGPRPISYLLNQSMIFLFLHLIVGNSTVAISYFSNAQRMSQELLVMEKMKIEKDLKILQQQMSPHFLFNNLNTLAALIPEDPEKAIQFTRKLSAVFRHATDYSNKELIPLSNEIQFAHDYIKLLSFRFGESYKIEGLSTLNAVDNYLIVPMTFQVIIENALKHNAASKSDPLIIRIDLDDDFIAFTNSIKLKYNQVPTREGIGLQNLNQQYQILTGKSVVLQNNGKLFTVKIPLLEEVKYEDINH